MRIFVVKSEKNMAGLRTSLARGDAAKSAVKAAEARLRAANPHVDFDRLKPGDVLVVPEAAGFTSARATSFTGTLLESSVEQARAGLQQLKRRVGAGEQAADRRREAIVRSLKSKAVKLAADRDEPFRKDVERLREAVSQDEKDAAARQRSLREVFDQVEADLADLRQRFA